MSFEYPYILLFIPFALILFFFVKKYSFDEKLFSKRVLEKLVPKGFEKLSTFKEYFLILSLVFSLIALSRPYIKGKEIKVSTKSYDIIVGFDISNSMQCSDIYPNRLTLAKEKFYHFLDDLKTERVGVLGFTSQAFLIAPPSTDYESLKFLVKNMKTDFISLKGTNILNLLISSNSLLKKSNKKAVLIFTDGGDKKDYQKEIEYAKTHNLKIYIYAIGTKKGGVIKTENGVLKDKNGDIVIVKLNPAIKALALKSGGAYQEYSLKNNDIKTLLKVMNENFKSLATKKEKIIKNNREIFYMPLLFAILLFFMANFSLPRRKSWE